jgi:hypothetical protein
MARLYFTPRNGFPEAAFCGHIEYSALAEDIAVTRQSFLTLRYASRRRFIVHRLIRPACLFIARLLPYLSSWIDAVALYRYWIRSTVAPGSTSKGERRPASGLRPGWVLDDHPRT